MPDDIKKDDTYSTDEVEIPTTVDAILPGEAGPAFGKKRKSNKKVEQPLTKKKLDYGERMRKALKASYDQQLKAAKEAQMSTPTSKTQSLRNKILQMSQSPKSPHKQKSIISPKRV